ncbi:MAG: TIGR01777 family oxidoreductase [Vicinamibacterales bacterium]
MTIVLAGGSGFLGGALHDHFTAAGHTVRTLTRHPRRGVATDVHWHPDGHAGPWADTLADADVVINLAGAGISDKRWTESRKETLRTSRLQPTRSLARGLAAAPPRPRTFVSGSAIGYYGPHGDEAVTEEFAPGHDFLARLCLEWEGEAIAAVSPDTAVAIIRTGIVLHPEGGALKTMLLPFRMGVGGPMGSGRQFMSWIHLHDWVRLVAWLATSAPSGTSTVWNATAPSPVTNARFSKALGRAVHRPAIVPVPGVALNVLLGEFATFLLAGARVLPAAAERAGFTFEFPTLDGALDDLL